MENFTQKKAVSFQNLHFLVVQGNGIFSEKA